jgi:hypothetical protein
LVSEKNIYTVVTERHRQILDKNSTYKNKKKLLSAFVREQFIVTAARLAAALQH